MESNIPVVGGSESVQETQPTAAPATETVDTALVNTPAHPLPDETSADIVPVPLADVATDSQPADFADLADDTAQDDEDAMHESGDQNHTDPGVKKGDILEGTVASTTPTEIMIELGLKSPGVIQTKELERMDRETIERLKVGEKVLVYVITPGDKNGNVVLSVTRALEEQDWRDAERLQASKEAYHGKVDGYNKGGLIVRFGRVRGFVPESQVSRDRRHRTEGAESQEKWMSMRGEDITVKVLEVDRARNRLILSERDAAPQLREAQKERLLDELQVGDIKIGHVKSLADFGAFVDVGGADGLVHLTELSWKHVARPQDLLRVGQEVKVEVISIDRERKRIGLSIKRQEEDPWMAIARQYAIGQLVQGTITKLTKFGAFARLVEAPEIEGLIHISELADHRVNHPRDVVEEGDVLTLRVVKIDAEQRRMGLSLKRVDSPDYLDGDYARATTPAAPVAPVAPRPTEGFPDVADFEAASIRSEDSSRRDRKRTTKKGGTARKPGGRDDFEEEESEY